MYIFLSYTSKLKGGIMDFFTPLTIIVVSICGLLFIIGIILMAKNIKPIMGFFCLVFALALLIGVLMDPKGFEAGIRGVFTTVQNIF